MTHHGSLLGCPLRSGNLKRAEFSVELMVNSIQHIAHNIMSGRTALKEVKERGCTCTKIQCGFRDADVQASHPAAIVEEEHEDLLHFTNERTPMKIRIKVNQSVDRSPCAHRDLTLAGRYLRLRGLDLKRSTERYTCNACGTPLVRTLKMSVSILAGLPSSNH